MSNFDRDEFKNKSKCRALVENDTLENVCDSLKKLVAFSALGDRPSASRMARLLCDEVVTDRFCPIAFPGGSEMILQYDEHVLTNTYKFGVIYQKFGQVKDRSRARFPSR